MERELEGSVLEKAMACAPDIEHLAILEEDFHNALSGHNFKWGFLTNTLLIGNFVSLMLILVTSVVFLLSFFPSIANVNINTEMLKFFVPAVLYSSCSIPLCFFFSKMELNEGQEAKPNFWGKYINFFNKKIIAKRKKLISHKIALAEKCKLALTHSQEINELFEDNVPPSGTEEGIAHMNKHKTFNSLIENKHFISATELVNDYFKDKSLKESVLLNKYL